MRLIYEEKASVSTASVEDMAHSKGLHAVRRNMDASEERPKAYLVLTVLGSESVRIPVCSNSYTIGRAEGCNYRIPNKLISGQHCCVIYDEGKGCFAIEDTSTNGMLLNKTVRTTKGQKLPIKNGDEVFLVYRKKDASRTDVISFQFEEVPQEVSEIDLDDTLSSEATHEYAFDEAGDVEPTDGDKKRKRKMRRKSHLKKLHFSPHCQVSSGEQSKKPHLASEVDNSATKQVVAKETVDEGDVSGDAGDASGDAGTREDNPESKGSETGENAMNESQDEIMETLICSICQDILHDCISLQPCMHTFCAACYSQWMNTSSRCPTCRKCVKRISKNHIVNNLVEAYLKTHPDKKRSQEEIDQMNSINKITADTVINPRQGDESFSEDSGDEFNSSSEIESLGAFAMPAVPSWGFLGNIISSKTSQSCPIDGRTICHASAKLVVEQFLYALHLTLNPRTCRQCPGLNPTHVATCTVQAQPSTSAGPSDASGDSTSQNFRIANGNVRVALPTAPAFVCPAGATHLMCQCCQERFPDRRRESDQSNIPSVACSLCQMFYCHMYWGCTRNSRCFVASINSKILILETNVQIVLFWETHKSHLFSSDINKQHYQGFYSVLFCGMKVFKELAYPYRDSIPRDQLPAEATSRPNCYWGRNCRTQHNKPVHAASSHICTPLLCLQTLFFAIDVSTTCATKPDSKMTAWMECG
ncbi:putative E3 ubiquitin-protein ligase CHFR-like [Apostichopus japonicus]|uniref:E3 ubiquitin-protein ligase CHFR n=1 Tax=Stichopus japonicus TaxID=307972 RepID=A0A2G8K9B7_STIJA|nr:putative E3 ubiquitin-protein ligase CHFR-like [Apostichopus japonicus]